MTSRNDSKAFVVNAKQLAQADPVAFIDALAAGYAAPVCELCDDQGERLVPVGRDAFGNWDTVAVPCSCAAGRVLAERLVNANQNDERRAA